MSNNFLGVRVEYTIKIRVIETQSKYSSKNQFFFYIADFHKYSQYGKCQNNPDSFSI